VRGLIPLLLAPVCGACGAGAETSLGADAAHAVDAAPVARCSPTGVFGPPVALTALDSATEDLGARFSPDESSLVMSRTSGNQWDIYSASRPGGSGAFSAPQIVAPANTIYNDLWPSLSPDGLSLVFTSNRLNQGAYSPWLSRRASLTAAWTTPVSIQGSTMGDDHPLFANAHALYFTRTPAMGTADIYRADIDASGAISNISAVIGGVNSPALEVVPVVTSDELRIYFGRHNGADWDIYTASRSSISDGFGAATVAAGLAQPGIDELPSWVSPDGCDFYFSSNGPGGMATDMYLVTRGATPAP
jgi:Tol biopolymer transport system component